MIFALLRIVYSKCKRTHEITAGASTSKMLDNHSWLLGETVSIYWRLYVLTKCTYAQLYKNKHFHAFVEFSIISVFKKCSPENNIKKKNSLRDSNFPLLQ